LHKGTNHLDKSFKRPAGFWVIFKPKNQKKLVSQGPFPKALEPPRLWMAGRGQDNNFFWGGVFGFVFFGHCELKFFCSWLGFFLLTD
jgi:hypothetical protein